MPGPFLALTSPECKVDPGRGSAAIGHPQGQRQEGVGPALLLRARLPLAQCHLLGVVQQQLCLDPQNGTDERRRYLRITPPAVLPEKSKWSILVPWHRTRDDPSILHGIGASAGQVTAQACVLFGPEDFPRMRPGDVLVAVTTTPAWTPLFAMASAVVTDIGGPLSHSSIVAREYGIPAVMAAGNATRRIQNGQMITVDGSAGTVTLKA